jgi:hypothetical protein
MNVLPMNKSFVFMSLVIILVAECQKAANSTGEAKMKSDVTIYLEPPILGGGGTIIVLPNEVPADEWRKATGLPNPALNDGRLSGQKPIGTDDRRLSAIVSDPISVVKFDYPAGGTFVFRPLPAIGSDYPIERQASKLVSIGSAGDLHPVTGEDVDIPRVQVLHVRGAEVSEERSRELAERVRLGFLEDRYGCRKFDHVLSCSASKDNLNE